MPNDRPGRLVAGKWPRALTQWGEIVAIGTVQGERYYWMIDKHGSVSMMPAVVVEASDD